MPAEAPEGGARPTLILIPGLLCDDAVWANQIAELRAEHDVVVPDVTRFSSIADMATSILASAPRTFSVAGHSMGARVALQIVADAPGRVDRLALLDTGVHPAQEGEAARRQLLLDVSATRGMAALGEMWLPPMVREGALEADPQLGFILHAMVQRMSPQIHRRQIVALLGRPDARSGLAAIRCPVLVGVGDQDRWSPPSQHEEIVAGIADATYVVFPASGHMAPLEAPEAVTSALRSWLQRPSLSRGQ